MSDNYEININIYRDGPTGHANVTFIGAPQLPGQAGDSITIGATVNAVGVDMLTSNSGSNDGIIQREDSF